MTGESGRSSRQAFAYVTTLFFAWGFATSLIDPLLAMVRRVFDLSYTEAFLTTFAWFIAYGAASLPAAALLGRLGSTRAIILALVVMVAGCSSVVLATFVDRYAGVLVGLFVIASGVTLLQVAANPLVAELGPKKSSHVRLNLSQGFNSLGTTVGPWLGSHVLLTGGVFVAGATVTAATRAESLRSMAFAFAGLGAFLAVIAGLVLSARARLDAARPEAAPEREPKARTNVLEALRSGWAVAGACAILAYVGSEVTIASLLTNFLNSPNILDVPLEVAGKMVAYYWGGAMVGRFVGSALLTRVPASRALTLCTGAAAALCLTVTQSGGATAAYAALAIGLFNSIMFPTIFTLTLERSRASTASTSGLLVFGIVGGALLPQAAAAIADRSGALGLGFFVPFAGYLFLTSFAVACGRASVVRKAEAVASH